MQLLKSEQQNSESSPPLLDTRMRIFLFGVSNVGKTTTGKLLADKLGIAFYNLDDEVKRRLGTTLEEFVHTANLRWRDQKRGRIIKEILQSGEKDFVFAVTPISFTHNFRNRIISENILSIELYDTPENIFSRLVFSDENDNIYRDDAYKNKRKEHYLNEIRDDLKYYGKIFTELGVENRVFINNEPPDKVVDRIISEYHLMDR